MKVLRFMVQPVALRTPRWFLVVSLLMFMWLLTSNIFLSSRYFQRSHQDEDRVGAVGGGSMPGDDKDALRALVDVIGMMGGLELLSPLSVSRSV